MHANAAAESLSLHGHHMLLQGSESASHCAVTLRDLLAYPFMPACHMQVVLLPACVLCSMDMCALSGMEMRLLSGLEIKMRLCSLSLWDVLVIFERHGGALGKQMAGDRDLRSKFEINTKLLKS